MDNNLSHAQQGTTTRVMDNNEEQPDSNTTTNNNPSHGQQRGTTLVMDNNPSHRKHGHLPDIDNNPSHGQHLTTRVMDNNPRLITTDDPSHIQQQTTSRVKPFTMQNVNSIKKLICLLNYLFRIVAVLLVVVFVCVFVFVLFLTTY